MSARMASLPTACRCRPDAPSFAQYLKDKAGYKTALIGKAHFEPGFDPQFKFLENSRQREGNLGPWRGFDYAISPCTLPASAAGPWAITAAGRASRTSKPSTIGRRCSMRALAATRARRKPAITDRSRILSYRLAAGLALDWLDTLDADEDWMLWLSFPDPHHPWDPPVSELGRCDWRDLPLPDGHPGSPEEIRKVLARKPAHWLDYYEGKFINAEGGPQNFRPRQLSSDNIREINAKVHVMNEMIDDAVGRVMAKIKARGWNDDTDVLFTTDHGELQGDFGLVYKGPFHVDALMRLPFIWRPAPNAKVKPAVVNQPVEQVDLASTFCSIAGIGPAPWMQGKVLPTSEDGSRHRAISSRTASFRATVSTSAQSTAMAMY